jgi:hypothetical protein
MSSPAFVRGLQGPIGSGKSVACVIECLKLMMGQERAIERSTGERTGKRKTRVGVIRNTTPQLETTTMKTWLEWLPEDVFGKVRWRAPFRQDISIPGLDVEAEVWFLALDRDEDVRKLLSFEFTFLWANEARELTRHVITSAISRVRRFPRIIEGGPTRACMIMDSNAPDEEHWWAIMSGQVPPPDWLGKEDRLTLVKPDNWEFFLQPPAVLDILSATGELLKYELNPLRENAAFTDQAYYTELLHGQTRGWITNMLQNKIGALFDGRPVYEGFNEEVHVSKSPILPEEAKILHVGLDFGTTPAAAFCQDVHGQFRAIDEIVSRDTHAVTFAREVKKKLQEQYSRFGTRQVVFTGDPAGDAATGVDENTAYKVFKSEGMTVQKAWSNDPVVRIGAVQTQMNTMVEGLPGYQVSPVCTYLVNAKKGGYQYKKDRETIDKENIHSHISDAEQYAALGAGLGRRLVGRGAFDKVQVNSQHGANIFQRNKPTARQMHRERKHSILSRGRH